jgi:hypothetical protein
MLCQPDDGETDRKRERERVRARVRARARARALDLVPGSWFFSGSTDIEALTPAQVNLGIWYLLGS